MSKKFLDAKPQDPQEKGEERRERGREGEG
jgi:hypothetical protein